MLLEDYESPEQLLIDSKRLNKQKKYGFKGFDKDLKCRGHQFVLGEVASKPEKDVVKMCSGDGFHYCNTLSDVFRHYYNSGDHRFCIVEIIGNFTDDNSTSDKKCITTSLRPVREITADEINNLMYEERIHLSEIKRIQQLNPFIRVGGSAALFLHGIQLKRISEEEYTQSDIDMCAPFYMPITGSSTDHIETLDEDERSDQADFKEVISFNGIPIDYRVDAKERFEVVKYKGFDYKVTCLEIIMEAKFRYAMKGSLKHKEDCYEICGKKSNPKEATKIEDDLFDLFN